MLTKNPQSGLVKLGISTSEEESVKQVQSSHFVNTNIPFSLLSPSSLLKLFIVVIQNICYHGNVRRHIAKKAVSSYLFNVNMMHSKNSSA